MAKQKRYGLIVLAVLAFLGAPRGVFGATFATSSYKLDGLVSGGTYTCPSTSPTYYWYELSNGFGCDYIYPPFLWKYTAKTNQTLEKITFSSNYYDGYQTNWRFDIVRAGATSTVISQADGITTCYPTACTQEITLTSPVVLTANQSIYLQPVKTNANSASSYANFVSFSGVDEGLLSIKYPLDDATTTVAGVYPYWEVTNSLPSSTATMLNAYPVLQTPTPQNIQTITKNETGNNVIIYDTFSFTPQPYYIYANALDINGDIIGTSTPITLWVETIPDTTTSTAYSACDSDETFTGRWFCRSMVFLFSPSQAVLNSFTRLTDRAKNAPPFNLLTEVSDALSFEATTTEQAVSSSTLEAFSGIFSPARNGIKVALWLLFAFWLIRAIRHIQT